MPRTAETIIADSSFWIALLYERDDHHQQASELASLLDVGQVLCPWPTLYETISTRFVRNRAMVQQYEQFLGHAGIHRIDDSPYRDDALVRVIESASAGRRHIALVDMVIRFILEDVSIRSDYLLTFNARDFRDVCGSRRIEILPAE